MDGSVPTGKTGVLLLHGLTGTPTEMSPVERRLKRQGMLVEVPLLAGHGKTHDELLATTWEDWAESARVALRRLASECDRIFVGGLCMGGMLSILLEREEPKIKGVIIVSMDAGLPAKGSHTWGFLLPLGYILPFPLQKRFYWTERSPFGLKDPVLREEIEYRLGKSRKGETEDLGTFRTYVPSLHQLSRLRKHVLGLAPRVRCAALILQSTEDTLTDPKNATIVYRALGTDRKTLCFMSGCDHMMTIDLRKKDVSELIATFIQSVA